MRAPGRVNLIGDHTDYNAGWCLPMAIDRACWVAARSVDTGRVRARSLDEAGTVDVPTGAEVGTGESGWGRFVSGAVEVTGRRGGATVVVGSTVPPGSGLASSAALCVALVLALGADPADRLGVAAAARAAEIRATGVEVGWMDQLASVLGHAGSALLLDCSRLEAERVALPPTVAVGVVHSGLPRTVATSDYAARRGACVASAHRLGLETLREATFEQVRDDPVARHVVTENRRVLAAADALRGGDVGTLGALLLESHASLRDDFAVSTPELHLLVELLVDEGAVGARLTGAGFGGCVVALTPPEARAGILRRASDRYRQRTDLVPAAFAVEAVGGAGPVPVRGG